MADGKVDNKTELQDEKAQHEELLQKLDEDGYDWNKHPKVQGIIHDNQKERELRHSVEDQLTQMRVKNEMLRRELEKEGSGEEDLDELDIIGDDVKDDDYLTVAQAKQLAKRMSSQQQKQQQQQQQQSRAERIRESESNAKNKYTADKVGEGLDYMNVIDKGYKEMVKENPSLHQTVQSSHDPAETAYRLGLTHPEVQEKMKEVQKQELLKKINNQKGPRGGSGGEKGLSTTDSEMESLLGKPVEELEAELRSMED